MVDVLDVGVYVDDNVPPGYVKRFPQVFAFAPEFFEVGKNFVSDMDIGPKSLGDLHRVVGRARVDNNQLIHQGIARHQFGLHNDDFFGNGFFFIQGRQAQGYFEPFFLLYFDQPIQVAELGVVEGICIKPFTRHHRPRCQSPSGHR